MPKLNRIQRQQVAQLTVEILESGIIPNTTDHEEGIYQDDVDISERIRQSVEGTRSYPPNQPIPTPLPHDPKQCTTNVTLVNTATLHAAKVLRQQIDPGRPVAVLNFASARNPGGGFLRGAMAQEESLALNSALYACIRNDPMYEYHQRGNKKNKTTESGTYSDWVIFSPDVLVFRNEKDGEILKKKDMFEMSVLTCPCINARQMQTRSAGELKALIKQRMIRMLQVLAGHHDGNLVLGAWGCGVFGNDPLEVARLFREILRKEPFRNRWPHIVFAVLDRTPGQKTIEAFQRGCQCDEIVREEDLYI